MLVSVEVMVHSMTTGREYRVLVPLPDDLPSRTGDKRLMQEVAEELLKAFTQAYGGATRPSLEVSTESLLSSSANHLVEMSSPEAMHAAGWEECGGVLATECMMGHTEHTINPIIQVRVGRTSC